MTRQIRLEVNLDIAVGVDVEELVARIRAGCNVYGVERVQAVTVVSPKPAAPRGWDRV